MTRTPKLTVALAAGLVLVGGLAVNAAPTSGGSTPSITPCAAMPYLWSGAGDIAYDPAAGTVTFAWDDGPTATLRDTDPGCDSQPGLVDQLQGKRAGYRAQWVADCADLRNLVDAVTAERRAQGEGDGGRVPVSDQAAERAARRNPSTRALADSGAIREKNQAAGQRTLDLDQSRAVLAACPS